MEDGSFSLDSSLEWFVSRCSKLESIPQISSLIKKGHNVTEDEVVNAVAELFLHTDYTCPVIGCFRPIARKIVDKAVSLLRLVPNLRSNSEDVFEEVPSEVFHVVEYCDRGGRGLDLHELACLAFCRALDLAPYLLGSVLSYFTFAPPPFERILMKGGDFEARKVGTSLLHAARISYRLLLVDTEVFSKRWNWSCFLELVKRLANDDLCSSADCVKVIVSDTRWCAIHILSIVLKLSNQTTSNLTMGSEEAFTCLLRWDEFRQDVLLEKTGWYAELFGKDEKDSRLTSTDFELKSFQHTLGLCIPMSSSIVDAIEPPMRSQRHAKWAHEVVGDSFVLTSSIRKSYEMVLLALSQKWPVLLYGPPGGGKSSLINKLARDSQNKVLSIHMDDQIDGKTLIGSNVCAEQPGEFRWQPGSLTQAVQNGLWVVFEDIDKAPSDVHSILLPLLESASSFATENGEVWVADSFRLFCTISTSKLDLSRSSEGGSALSLLWRKVMIGPPNNEDLKDIIKSKYPNIEPITDRLIETFERVICTMNQLAGFNSRDSSSYMSRFMIRQLLKWCKRITGLGFSFDRDCLSAYQSQCIYQEAVDIFAAFSTSAENRLILMKDIAKLWSVPASVTETLYSHNKPSIQDSLTDLRVGRVHLQRTQAGITLEGKHKSFVEIRTSLHTLERIACSVMYNEPVLLVGETGTGKTTLVQNLAARLGQKLTVLNLSQQSDVADLLGGFKPIDAQFICFALYEEFINLFSKSLSQKANRDFVIGLQREFSQKNWRKLLNGFRKVASFVQGVPEAGRHGSGKKRKKPVDEEQLKAWETFGVKLEAASRQIESSSGMIFSFVEGAFVTALKNGEWILLDEINLAPPETLQRVVGVLEGENGSLCLAERGDINYICRHPNFRIFACMNPATDAGKRDLPLSLRNRYTEYFVDDVLDDDDLALFIHRFVYDTQSSRELVNRIVCFYKAAKKASEEKLQDGANQKPQYSLRSLYRALEYKRKAERTFNSQGKLKDLSLYDGFSMFFLTLLDPPSSKIMNQMIVSHLLNGKIPPHVPFDSYLTSKVETRSDDPSESYILTKSVREHLRNLARAILIKRYPVLLQGPTSSGKTSLVKYLAAITGHEFVRINNHEHTDLQEYLGTYITDACGNLVFQEGMLVKAVRNGFWIVLDELNLAPSDVLEALNRLLDDNRELFVPELRETIKAHPDFMLFATQNPPTFYGGRKMLSRAFRNRFVEILVEEIPEDELSTIVEKRCGIPESYSKKMVDVMKDLQMHRQSSKVFAGKHGFITPRDLFRWAYRFKEFGCSYEDLARDGYYLLAERLRSESEQSVVQEILERHLRVRLFKHHLYKQEPSGGDYLLKPSDWTTIPRSLPNIVLTKSMQRLCFLVERCYKNLINREPVLLVGETGGGKTTVCQLLSARLNKKLHILNCHQYTETSDFIGGFYPIRERSKLTTKFKNVVERLISKTTTQFHLENPISLDIGRASSTLDSLDKVISSYRQGLVSYPNVSIQDLEHIKKKLSKLNQKWNTIFTWQDGPLVQAMRDGDLFLIDEISLADDSVLERLNSVLEPERKLSLAEKGGSHLETIAAHPEFFLLATMNPGGDYGKKELSPALRNRFTEIWVPPVNDLDELRSIALSRISNPKPNLVDLLLRFWEWFNQQQSGRMLTVRDLNSWVTFMDLTKKSLGPEFAFLHGAFLVLLDGLSLGTGMSHRNAAELREKCFSFLSEKIEVDNTSLSNSKLVRIESYGWGDIRTTEGISSTDNMQCDNTFGIDPFFIEKGHESSQTEKYELFAPTVRRNSLRVLRAMQLPKPVLLEGSPGVGKTSLIVALGKFSGHRVVRINLSEQTDIMDLLGSDLPLESEEGIKFAWSDGILLQALKEGCWVLLDELNLAPQSVLEGLNAILDHRAEVFIPELGVTFKCPSSFRVFACQNPSAQGGGRKGLPKSFLNRFTKVYLDELVEDDYLFICSSLYKSIPRSLLSKLILFNRRLHEETMVYQRFAQEGSPWEFNLRDVFRSCQIIEGAPETLKDNSFLNVLYIQRMRTAGDRREVLRLYEQVFGVLPFINPYPRVQLNSRYLIVGATAIERNDFLSSNVSRSHLKITPGMRQNFEAAAHCVQNQWLCILIGPSCSGKMSLIRSLAQLTGNVLNELNLSSATDISELLGCFQQYNAIRNFHSVVDQVEYHVNKYCNLQFKSSSEGFACEGNDINSKWLVFSSGIGVHSLSSSPSLYLGNWKNVVSSLGSLVEIIDNLMVYFGKDILSTKELDRAKTTILKLQGSDHRPFSAKFEWVVGVLLKALERGEWIVLKNANLCNPTVLDRINSLVEPSGSITINECGTVDGEPVVFHPHRNFRMFLTINPNHGEVSRAMRNRGVEIFMMQPYWVQDEGDASSHEGVELEDVKKFISFFGIPGSKLVESMAKAHLYARNKGAHLNAHITNFELGRWVQLFQQLVMNGNKAIWSLCVSWEHTYRSSLGEEEGMNIIWQAKDAYLFKAGFSESDFSMASLCVPGGWPMPLKLMDFVWYPKESNVKQNCKYLEFLGAQCAAYDFRIASKGSHVSDISAARSHAWMYLMDMKNLSQIMYPKASNAINGPERETDFNLDFACKKLAFAANWTVEQGSESDMDLYILWLSWFNSRLQPFCQFFEFYLISLNQVMKHQVWNHICYLRKKIVALSGFDLELLPVPILSPELVNLTISNDEFTASMDNPEVSKDALKSSCKLLCNAIECIGSLRCSYQQWNMEDMHEFDGEARYFIPVLKSLRILEEEIFLKLHSSFKLAESPFHVLIQLYCNLLDNHISFWNGLTSSKFEQLLVSWNSLMKDVVKFKHFCPESVENFLRESQNLEKVTSFCLRSEKSLLWVHGGHPVLPSSADLYHKQHQLFKLCDTLWPVRTGSWNQSGEVVSNIASSNPELRFLAVEGLSMSSCIVEKCKFDEDDDIIVQNLEDMYQMLLRRFEFEGKKVELAQGSKDDAISEANSSLCCSFSNDFLLRGSRFDIWLDALPLIDSTSFFLDMALLQELSSVYLVKMEGSNKPVVGSVSKHVKTALDFSLRFSSRPPQIFLPHQNILWTFDDRTSVDTVKAKAVSFVVEMWFRWHQSLWNHCLDVVKNFSKVVGSDTQVPYMLLQPVKAATIFHILRSSYAIKDFYVHCSKIKVASCNLWLSPPLGADVPCFLLSAARSLFHQILCAHQKSFDAAQFTEINTILNSVQKEATMEENIQRICSLIKSSNHQRLKNSVHKFIQPLLLYLHYPSRELDSNIGHAWIRLGVLRFHLLLDCGDLDPGTKYQYKYSQLVNKKSDLELEIQVRKECKHLAGSLSMGEVDKKRALAFENIEVQRRGLQRKIIFRLDPGKFKKLKHECNKFLDFVNLLLTNLEAMKLQQIVDQVHNWQETASRFIDRLSDEYAGYIDIVQPVQIAVYEMKLGLSLVMSTVCFPNRVGQHSMQLIKETIYSFMRFPRVHPLNNVAVCSSNGLPGFSFNDISSSAKFCATEVDLLEKLVVLSSETAVDSMVSIKQLKASLHYNLLVRVSHSVADTQLMDGSSFALLDKTFNEFADLWMSFKVKTKTKEEFESQSYKFRPRVFKIEKVLEADVGEAFANDGSPEWKEFLSEKETTEMEDASKELEIAEEDWNLVPEPILNHMIWIHNQLFGSSNLILPPGVFKVSDTDRLSSFSDSYTLGLEMIRVLCAPWLPSLDSKLAPEHSLRLCLEHEEKLVSSRREACRYNFYKDSNAPVMAKMVKLLAPIRQRVSLLLHEQESSYGLQKIWDITEMLLSIPMNSPLAKALSGLQVLFNTCQTLQESGSKYGLSDQLEPIRELVSLWKAMEFDSWPALLDEVQDQYETDAGKLWFPLHSVLQNRSSADISGYNESMIQSLNDLMNTSSIGDFRKRLQLLFAFFGQINTGGCLNLYSSVFDVEKVKVLYNLFGYYVQFLPVILEHRDTKRKEIELELKKLQKLCRWEHLDSHLSIENSRRTRMKLRKIIQKYSDLLQQPVVPFINPNASQKGTHQIQPLHSTFDQGIFDNEDRFLWLSNWREKVHNDLQSMCLQKPSRFDITFLNIGGAEEVVSIIRQLASQPTTSTQYEEEWKAVWYTLGNIYTKAVYCSELWKDSKKSQKKRWALSELLKLLETSGLSKHKSLFAEGQVKSWWFLQPSYDVQHLLLTQSRLSSGTSDMAGLSNVQSLENEGSISEWKRASEYYFKSIASVQFLQHKCLNFHKDVTGEQVERSKSFLNQLIDIQQKQQSAANYFANHLQRLKNSVSMLEKLYSNTSNSDSGIDYEVTVIQNQDAIYKCMWEQKQVLDSLCAMMHEELLLLKTTANTHSNTCQSVRTPANQIFETIDKFLPVFQISKISLDDHLLAQSRAMTTLVTSSHTSIVTKKMKDLLLENFEGINTFREHLSTFFKDFGRTSVEKVLLGHFDEVFEKASLIEKEFKSTLEANEITNTLGGATCSLRNPSKLDTAFNESFRNTIEHIIKALGSFQFISSEHVLPQEFLGKVTSWEFLFRSFTESLGLDSLCDKILKTISCVVKLLNHSDEGLLGNPILETNRNHFQIGAQFKQLNVLLYSMMNFADCLLKEFLAMHCTVSATTSVLATIFTDLYSQGFGTSNEEQVDSANDDKTQDASGTGMAEGIGMNDVSDELLDEDQLIGTDDKPSEEQAGPNEVPSKTDKGIEMEQDFNADTFSVSEDSGEEDEDSGDEQLESTIGEAGTNSEAVDEKLWDKNEDENPTNEKEKYESGPSVKDEDASSRELRAMDDSAPSVNESGEVNPEELDGQQDEIGSDADHGDGEDAEDMELDKDEAFTEPTGLNIEESNQRDEENLDMDDNEAEDTTKEADAGEQEDSVENEHNEEEKGGPLDETMVEADETQKEGEASEMDGQDRNHEDNVQTDLPAPRKDFSQPGTTEFIGGNTPNPESSNQAIGDRQASESKNTAPESNWFNNNENRNDHGISRGLPSGDTSQMDEMATDLSNSGRLNSDQPKTQIPEQESSSLQKAQPNPFRNIGDALKEWKERARVLSDLQADDMEVQEEVEDKDADEYGYVPESVEGTTQAMGLATSEQNEKSVKNNDLNRDSVANNSVDLTEMEIERKNSEANPLRSSASFLKSKMEDPFQLSGIENIPMEESQDDHTLDSTDPRNLTENLVFVMKPHNNEPINQFAKLSVSDEELGKAQDPVEVSNEVRNNATALWRRYELLTTRLSQELAEQLRLVLEPTLASKLQGDYKTGKRINMKKVIPYIASHYRKDKIWLRRTRPNKRDYQVVIAIDDSHSMSESGCGGVATEALVTVCRAMSQLEIGSLAVASFGKKGNIRLLHEFDQQFTGEAGIKMISNLTFKQENSITDEPLLDLLKYLNSMLDTAVSKARLPSGQNPLQQLVLIIADGRMTEKDRLKRYVRDALGRKRMVAFLLLDSQQESIMDLKEATFPGGKTVFTKYLDSFPFPYYIVLRNIEALPSTLADLLRQWFEVMQYSGE